MSCICFLYTIYVSYIISSISLESLSDAIHKIEQEQAKNAKDIHGVKKIIIDVSDAIVIKFDGVHSNMNEMNERIHTLNPDLYDYLDLILPWPMYWNVQEDKTEIYERVPVCCSCDVNPRRIIWNPCRHVALCYKCMDNMNNTAKRNRSALKCPICRAEHTATGPLVTGEHKGFEVIRWTDVGKDWHEQKPDVPDHMHFYLTSQAFGVASGQQAMRRDRFDDLIV